MARGGVHTSERESLRFLQGGFGKKGADALALAPCGVSPRAGRNLPATNR